MNKIQHMVNNAYDKLFIKNMQDLVRGIRLCDNEQEYISECCTEIRSEIRVNEMETKCLAVAKLIYLNMLGYDVSWASFAIIEVMSSTKYRYKKVAYLASSIIFHADIEVLMLTTNLLKKDLNSRYEEDIFLALDALSNFVTLDIARDIYQDVLARLSSSNEIIRCRATLVVYKIFLSYPEALPQSFVRLKSLLHDPSHIVQLAAVNVMTELARYNPKSYVGLAPIFYDILIKTSSNWLSIKIVKFFAYVAPYQLVLGTRIIEPLTNYIHTTSAVSLLYECVKAVLAIQEPLFKQNSDLKKLKHGRSHYIDICIQKLVDLVQDTDQNLKYLGLYSIKTALKLKPSSISHLNHVFFECLDAKDVSIQSCAIDLLKTIAKRDTTMNIVKKLFFKLENSEGLVFRNKIFNSMIDICKADNYSNISNFEWYVGLLIDLVRLEGNNHGKTLANCLIDLTTRVTSIQLFTVEQCSVIIEHPNAILGKFADPKQIYNFLSASVFLVSEYYEYLYDPVSTLTSLLKMKINYPDWTQITYLQSIFKLYARIVYNFEISSLDLKSDHNSDNSEKESRIKTDYRRKFYKSIKHKMSTFFQSTSIELKELAQVYSSILSICHDQMENKKNFGSDLIELFDGRLEQVAPTAQKRVPIPESINLNKWIYAPPTSPIAKRKTENSYGLSKSLLDDFNVIEFPSQETEPKEHIKNSHVNLLTDEINSQPQSIQKEHSDGLATSINLLNINVINDSLNITRKNETFKKKKRNKRKTSRKPEPSVHESSENSPILPMVAPYTEPDNGKILDESDDDEQKKLHRNLNFELMPNLEMQKGK
ncbi:AP-3 complex subunit delta [Intoshia linei]|uniref:AP-3 complex subunit delta n=1 Tax=Intoshia linei TaxID=1819745 RepID=A0A177B7C9_9BILA|nr:AP-3 complex subunit delta [Intoshia linei]